MEYPSMIIAYSGRTLDRISLRTSAYDYGCLLGCSTV
jgi:hypothetical protein